MNKKWDLLFYSLGTAGDALPFLKLASKLNARGLKSAFIGSEKFTSLACHMGVDCIPVSTREEYQKTYENPLTWSISYSQNHYNEFHFPALKSTYRAIESIINRGSKPLIIYQDVLSGARMASEKFGLKSCQIALAPQAIGSVTSPSYPMRAQLDHRLWSEIIPQIREKARKDTFDRLVKPLINPARKELGLEPWSLDDIPDMRNSPSILALFPEWLKSKPSDWPKQLINTGFILGDTEKADASNKINDFVQKFGAPIVFTFGTGIPVNKSLIDKIRHLCLVLSRPGVFVAHSQNDALIENGLCPVLILSSVPFSYLFKQAAAVIHHGGIGTCAQALAAGTPQVISPYTFDQPDNAFLLWQLGISNAIDFVNDSVSDIAVILNEIINSENINKKVKIFQSLTKDATDSSVDFLLSLRG